DTTTGKQVALKQISTDLNEQTVLKFKQEFRLMTQLTHPNCCKVFDFGVNPDGTPFYTMEVVPGHGLDEIKPISGERIREMLAQLLRALAHVHQLGFVHRDIKAENVRITPDGTIKLMDYGLMEYAGRSEMPISGTLGYISPEVIKRGPVDQRADLYSVGALAFEMAAGRLPFIHTSRVELLRAHVAEPPLPLSQVVAGIDQQLEDVVARLLAKEPTDRFQSADEVLTALGFAAEAAIPDKNLLAPPLIGREEVTARLGELLSAIQSGQEGATVVLQGPAGVGKSRLIKDFRSNVQVEGATLAMGGSRDQATPYTPFREALRSLVPALKEYVPDTFALHAPVLATLLPELDVQAAPEMDSPNKEKIRLQGAVTQLLVDLAEKRGFILLLEDWHWVDPLSADLLDYLLRNTQGLPVLTVLTTRQLPTKANWVETAEVVELGRLSELAIRRIVMAMLGTEDVAPTFLDEVARVAEGNPFYVERCLEHLVSQGILTREGGRWNTDIQLDSSVLPSDMQALMLRKLATLPEDAIGVARVAAVVSREMELDLVQKITGLTDERLLDAFDALQRNQVLVQTDHKTFVFGHAIFREVIYGSFRPSERTAMHAIVAGALEAQIKKGELRQAPIELVTAIADNYILGCIPDKIVAYGIEAGRRSAALFAADEAEHYLSNAITLLKSDNSPRWQKPKLLALRLLADTLRLVGKGEAARDLYLEAIPLAQQIGAQDYLSRMFTSLADVYVSLENMSEALMCCQRSLEISLGNDNKPAAVRSYLTSNVLQFMVGNLAGSLEDTENALAMARELDDKNAVAEALAFLGHLYVAAVPNKSAEGITHLTEAVVILDELGNKVGLANAYNLLGAAQYRQGDFKQAWDSFELNQRISQELGLVEEVAFGLLNQSITAYELGKFADGVAKAKAADDLAQSHGYAMVHALAVAFMSAGKAYLGRLAEATRYANEAMGLFKESKNKYLEGRVLEHRIALLLYMGRLKEARETGEHLLSLLEETGNTEPIAHVHAMLGEIVARDGSLDDAERHLDLAFADALAADAKGVLVQVFKNRAYIALQREKFDDARAIAREALLMSYRCGTAYQTVELQGIQGEIDLAEGKGEAATPYFKAMVEQAEAMGAVLPQALGLFGQAAANPYEDAATKCAARAQQLVHAMVAGLDSESVSSFWSMKERLRVMNGNYIDFSIKKVQRPTTGPLMNLKFNHGMM
ncbi:MAG: putative serine/threonine protein kinase, partial [Cyanobacteria bacterium RYN_339]|nr:putative serine/threonine protein kinase [Cyanobacteria bacterium RYN_339]